MRRCLLAAVLFASHGAAFAGFPVTERMTCPIGGERFEFVTTASYSTFGARPDGKPYGSWTFPLALPECPGNGLIVYKAFDRGELRRLEAIIVTDSYRALRSGNDVQYYRLARLLREMGAPPAEHLGALVQAGWEAELGTPLRTRYLGEFAEGMAALPAEPADLSEFAMRGRWINALRELGRFDEAGALLARTQLEPLRAAAAGEPRNLQGWLDYYAMMRTLIERRDSSAEPLDFLSREEAAARCVREAASLDERQRAYCGSEAMRPAVARAVEQIGNAERDVGDIERAAEELERAAEAEAERPDAWP